MKCTTIIDKNKEEEVVIYLKEAREISKRIEELVAGESVELIAYGEDCVKLLSPEDIFCVTVEGGRVIALTQNERFSLRQRLYRLEEILGTGFVKINQSSIVNVKKIERFDASIGGSLMLTLKNGHRDYVSRRQLKTVKERIGFRL